MELEVQKFLASGGKITKIDESSLEENLKEAIDDATDFRNNYFDPEKEKAFVKIMTKGILNPK